MPVVSALKQQSALTAEMSKSAAHEDLVDPSKPDVVKRPDTAEAGKRDSESRVDGEVQGPKSEQQDRTAQAGAYASFEKEGQAKRWRATTTPWRRQ